MFRREICLLQPDSGAPRSPSSSRNIWGAQDDQGDSIVQKWKCAPIYLWWQLINWGLHDRPDRTWCDPRAFKRTNFDRSEEAFYMFVPNRFVYIPEMTGTGVARSRREIIWNACGRATSFIQKQICNYASGNWLEITQVCYLQRIVRQGGDVELAAVNPDLFRWNCRAMNIPEISSF